MNKKRYWLKIKENYFDEDEIVFLKSQTNGYEYIYLWMRLLLKCLKVDKEEDCGMLRINDKVPYDINMLSTLFNINIDVVRTGIEIFKKMGILEILDDGTFYIEAIQKMIGKESESAERVQQHREKKLLITSKAVSQKSIPYIEKYQNNKYYNGLYYEIIARDKGQCICGSEKNLCIHHIIGYRELEAISCERWAMILLCRECHSKEHANPHNIITDEILSKIKFDMQYYNKINEISNNTGLKNINDVTCNNFVTSCNDNTNTNKEKEEEKEIKKEIDVESFKKFWDLYDKKIDKVKSEKLWNKIKPELYDKIYTHVIEYVKSTPDKQYRKHPDTYLRNKCWNDEIIKPKEQSNEKIPDWCIPKKSKKEPNTTLEPI